MCSIQHVGNVIQRAYGADGLTIACQVSLFLGPAIGITGLKKNRMAKQQGKLFPMSTFTSFLASFKAIALPVIRMRYILL